MLAAETVAPVGTAKRSLTCTTRNHVLTFWNSIYYPTEPHLITQPPVSEVTIISSKRVFMLLYSCPCRRR